MVVVQGAVPLKKGEVRRGLDSDVTRAEREAVAEWVWRVERGAIGGGGGGGAD